MPAALLAALALQAATPEMLADLERAYDQSCLTRIYGQFDDVCATMEAQVKRYRAELKRRPKPAPAPGSSPPQAEPAPSRPAPSPTPARSAPVPDQASTPNPLPPTDAAPEAPSATGPGSTDSLAQAFEAVRGAGPAGDDTPEIAADDVGATSLAEEMGAGSQKP